jgi:hypothetical protein
LSRGLVGYLDPDLEFRGREKDRKKLPLIEGAGNAL